ncbi:MAG TPA: endonuclease/exonuclease/phosphatase family protein [Thermoanaerobaculia bacterium]|nr:endonuclease/exonuclease/phosphatase family protein [Thermoanaerobaculia bacterium]
MPGTPSRLRLLTLNMAHGRRRARHQALVRRSTLAANLHLIAAVLRREAPDVVALQEADGPSTWSGRFDHIHTLARLAGYRHAFRGRHQRLQVELHRLGVALGLDYGTALLSRLPLADLTSHAFRANWRDTKGFVAGAIALPGGGAIDVVSVHLDFLHPAVRRRQVAQLVARVRNRQRPLAILGDFNCEWGHERTALQLLARELSLVPWPGPSRPTYPARRPLVCLDWILVSEELEFVGYRTLADPLSDHLGVLAEVELRPAARVARAS